MKEKLQNLRWSIDHSSEVLIADLYNVITRGKVEKIDEGRANVRSVDGYTVLPIVDIINVTKVLEFKRPQQ